jgi:hypothetical protein
MVGRKSRRAQDINTDDRHSAPDLSRGMAVEFADWSQRKPCAHKQAASWVEPSHKVRLKPGAIYRKEWRHPARAEVFALPDPVAFV